MTQTRAENVMIDGGRVWIEGVGDGQFGISWDMLMRAMQALLEYRGEKTTLSMLMAYSGDAFNLCHASNWQGIGYLCIPTDTVANAAAAFGYPVEAVHDGYGAELIDGLPRDERVEVTRATLERIYAEIDAGRPVLVGGAEDHCGSWSIAVGYDRGADTLCHVGDGEPYRWTPIRGIADGSVDEDFGHWNGRFRGAIRENFVGGWQCNPAFLIGQRAEVAPERLDVTIAALQRAVELHTARSHHINWWGGVDYFFGVEAYEQWAQGLDQLDYPADLDRDLPEGAYDWYEMGNMDIQVDQIMRGRGAAAEFCRYATVLMRDSVDNLLAAADAYDRQRELARDAFTPFVEGTDGDQVEWLSDEQSRARGAEAIRAMLDEERTAVEQISLALQHP